MSYDRLQEPNNHIDRHDSGPRYQSDTFVDTLYDDDEKSYPAVISYDYFYYDKAIRVCKLTVATSLTHVEVEQVKELLELREGKQIVLETSLELV